jgi:hypothetical protein
MDSEDWHWYGLTVRTRDGTVVGVVVGVFAEGLLAGRLRVQGHYRHRCTAWTETAVYAIPRSAVWGRYQDVTVVRAPALLAGGVRLFPLTRATGHVRSGNERSRPAGLGIHRSVEA